MDPLKALEDALTTGTKTPVMWLQEICVKQGCSHPKYEEKDLRAHISDAPRFEIIATAVNFNRDDKDITASGFATTKKQAKQKAAVALLSKLGVTPLDLADVRSNKSLGPSPYSVPKVQPEPVTVEPTTPVLTTARGNEIPIQVDPVSRMLLEAGDISTTSCNELMELCAKRGLPNPEYTELKDEGPPHCKKFYLECRVKTLNGKGDVVVVVVDNQKKKAKNLSAATMLHRLKSEVHSEETKVQLIAFAEKQQELEPRKVSCDDLKRCHQLIAHEHHKFLRLIGPAILELHENNQDLANADHEAILTKIGDEENFIAAYTPVDFLDDLGKKQCYCELKYPPESPLKGLPSVFVGEGDSSLTAQTEAAREALCFLKIVSKP